MGKLLRNTTLRSVGRAIVSLLLFFCFSQGVWADDARGKTIYLKAVGEWTADNPQFCLYYFDSTDNTTGAFIQMTQSVHDNNCYYATVPLNAGYECNGIIFVRRQPNQGDCNWNNLWGQTVDLAYSDASNLCTVGSGKGDDGKYYGTWSYTREFSEGEYIYLKNIIPQNWSSTWINTTDATYAYLYTYGGTAGTHAYRFILVPGTGSEGAENSVYGAQITTSGTYTYFKLTRGNTPCEDCGEPSAINTTNQITYPESYNYISGGYTANSSSVTWGEFDPCTVPDITTASAPAEKSHSTARLTGSYTTENVCVPISKGVAYKTEGGSYTYETDGTSSAGSILVNLSGLSPLTTYYYRAYVELTGGNKEYGDEYSFTTDCNGDIDITTNPEGAQTACLGSAAALSVEATGASNLTYQWYYSSTNESKAGATAVPGATSATYTPAMVGAFYYYCAVGAAGGYCEKESKYSGLVTIKGVPVLSASTSSTTNYAPVKISAAGAENITWSITSGTGGYLYKTSDTQAMFKGNVGEGSATTYTIQGAANGCNGTTTVTVNSNADNCQ